jgi:hypothetical protein
MNKIADADRAGCDDLGVEAAQPHLLAGGRVDKFYGVGVAVSWDRLGNSMGTV